MRRWLTEDAIKPWQYRSWIFITDPDFEAKAQRVLDLYARTWDGKPLGPQRLRDLRGREDLHPGPLPLPPHPAPGRARTMRVNHDYHRGGAVAYLAAYDVHRGEDARPLRGHHRDRTVHRPGRAGDDPRALRIRRAGVLDRGQRLLAPRPEPRSTGSPPNSRTRSWCTPRCTRPG